MRKLFVTMLALALVGCGSGGGGGGGGVVAVGVSPDAASVTTGGTQQFTASVSGTANPAVSWSVLEAGGGSITGAGLYTAPNTAGTYHVRATSQADSTKSADATVTVTAPSVVSVSVSPATPVLSPGGAQTFTATVSGTANQAVTWSVVEAGGGTVGSTGAYVAPLAAGTYHVKATSVADPSKSATATVQVVLTGGNGIATGTIQ